MRNDQRGSAAVEFALVLPILLIVVLAVVQVGLVLRDQLLVSQAARAAARQAVVTEDTAAVQSAAAQPGLDPAALSVQIDRTGGQGEAVTARVAYQRAVTVPFVGWLFPNAITLEGSATMRQEFEP